MRLAGRHIAKECVNGDLDEGNLGLGDAGLPLD
jgi:hypothetical protein